MGTGCSTEMSQAKNYGKSHAKDDNDRVKRNRNKVRKQSTASSSSISVKVNKQWTQSISTTMPTGLSYVPNQSQLIIENSSSYHNLETKCLENEDPSATDDSTAQNITKTSHSPSLPQAAAVVSETTDQIKLPPRLGSVPCGLQDLLLGHHKDPSVLIGHPQVIHLKIIAPRVCVNERICLWSNTFMPLRLLCANKGYVLDIQDDLWSSPNLDRAYNHLLTLQEDLNGNALEFQSEPKEDENVDVALIMLMDAFDYQLPTVLSHEDYTLILVSMHDPVITAFFRDLYTNNENRVPPCYELNYHIMIQQDEAKLNRLVNLMMAVYERKHKNTQIFNSDYHNQLIKILQDESLLNESTVLVSLLFQDHADVESECSNDSTLKNDKIKDNYASATFKCFEKECSPENYLQLLPAKDVNTKKGQSTADADVNFSHLKDMSTGVKEKLERLLLKEINQREENRREIATGIPHLLIEELVTQTIYHQRMTSVKPLLKSPTLISLQDYITTVSKIPIVVFAEPGWGLSTMGAQLVSSCLASMPTSVIVYRSMGISPDSRTVMSILLSIKQQLDVILGPSTRTQLSQETEQSPVFNETMSWDSFLLLLKVFHFSDNGTDAIFLETLPINKITNTEGKESSENILTMETLLSDIVSRSTDIMPILIILEGIYLTSAQLKELDIMTLTELLPVSTKLVVMTSDPDVARGLRTKMKDAFYVKATHWDKQSIVSLFTERMNINKRILTDSQNSAVATAISNCPLPMYAVIAVKLATSWRHLTEVCDDDLPGSLEEILVRFFKLIEHWIPVDCFSFMMAYLTISVGGISKWEMTDLLSVNDSVLASIYSDAGDSPIRRAPTILWKFITACFRSYLNLFLSKHFYTYSWTSGSFRKHATVRYVSNTVTCAILHEEINDYFMGHWTNKKKQYPDAKEEKDLLQNHFIIPQPDRYGKYLNVRRFMCLPFHLMSSKKTNALALEMCIFNLLWIENKLNTVSVLQVMCDLEQAKSIDTPSVNVIKEVQQAMLQSFSMLQVHGGEIYRCLQHVMVDTSKGTENDSKTQLKSNNGNFLPFLSSPPVSFLHPLDEVNISFAQICNFSSSLPSFDTIVPVSNNVHETSVVVTLKSEGEIRVINILRNQNLRTLKGLDLPQSLLMLNSTTAVVLCNRELYVIDLDKGKLLNKLRGVLNLQMPFFGRQNDEKIVALSRDRMVVNILDINTGGIVTTFKAGETRFLDSLIISGDGRILVCGDETQKPFPLLVWSLEQCKLLHDIRMLQHEFITQLSAITYNGQYLACGCREVNDSASNFVAIYDLISGHLFRKFKMASLFTAVSLASKTMCVVTALDTGQLVVWDLVLGNLKFLMDGPHVAIDNIILSLDDKICLTTFKRDFSISSYTISLWNLHQGHFVSCYTFYSPVTCAQFTPDGRMVLVGIRSHPSLVRLLLVPEGGDITTTKKEWEADKDSASTVFEDVSIKETVINVSVTKM